MNVDHLTDTKFHIFEVLMNWIVFHENVFGILLVQWMMIRPIRAQRVTSYKTLYHIGENIYPRGPKRRR